MSTRRPLPLRAVVEPLEARIAPAAVVALDSENHLLRFDSATPGMATGSLTVTGLGDGVRLAAIDFRPTTGYLYALGVLDGPGADDTAVSLYGINLVDGSVYLVGDAPFATDLADGAAWSLDFDPVSDLARAVSSSGAHYTIPPDDGGATAHTPLSQYIGLAYDRSFPGAPATTLYGFNFATGTLNRIGGVDGAGAGGSPDDGVTTSIGALGVTLGSRNAGFDIDPTGAVYAAFEDDTTGLASFYTVDLATGLATRVGTLITGGPIVDIAAIHFAWSGNGSTPLFSDPGNWWSHTAPESGDMLSFTQSTDRVEPVNDYAPGTAFHSLRFATDIPGGYYLSGNAITLTHGIQQFAGTTGVTIALPLKLGSPQAFSSDGDAGILFSRTIQIDLNGHALTFDGSGPITTNSVISSSVAGGSVIKSGTGTVTFVGDNTYDGATTLNDGTLALVNNQPQSAITVNGGTLMGDTRIIDGLPGVGSVHATSGTVAPGFNGIGALGTKGLVLDAGSTLAIRLEILDGATTSGRVNVTGNVTLNGANLSLDIPTPLPVGTFVTLIANDGSEPISGTFAGFAISDTVSIGGVDYTLKMNGGDGNDVVLSRGAALTVNLIDARTATYRDVDGDLVTIRVTKGTLNTGMFTLQPGGFFGGAQLELVNLGAGFGQSNLSITARPQFADNNTQLDGDGFVNVGGIDATGSDLAVVLIRGDLGFIKAGNSDVSTAGIGQLSVQSIGRFDTSTQGANPTLQTRVLGPLGKLSVATDMFGSDFQVSGAGQPKAGTIGSITVGGSLNGGSGTNSGRIYASGNMGPVSINGHLYGSQGASSASVVSDGAIKSVFVGGDLIGTGGLGSASIVSGGGITSITIAGMLYAGSGANSSSITAAGAIGQLHIGGSVLGFTGDGGASITAASIGTLKIDGSLQGSGGDHSARIHATGSIRSVGIGGEILGGAGPQSGSITLGGKLTQLRVGGEIRGGAGAESALIKPGGGIDLLTVSGSILGGSGNRSGLVEPGGGLRSGTVYGDIYGGSGEESGQIYPDSIVALNVFGSVAGGPGLYSGTIGAVKNIGRLSITGDLVGSPAAESGNVYAETGITTLVIGGSIRGSSGESSGSVGSGAAIGTVQILGSIEGSSGRLSGAIDADGTIGKVTVSGALLGGFGEQSGTIRSDAAITTVVVKGAIYGGTNYRAGAIRADGALGSVTVGTLVGGSAPLTASITSGTSIGSVSVLHDASGGDYSIVISAPGTQANGNMAIRRASFGGQATDVLLLGGYDLDFTANGDASIGDVVVKGDWIAGSIVSGVAPEEGGLFGDGNDTSIGGSLVSRIASITVGGVVRGSRPLFSPFDHFAFTADQIGKVSVGGYLLPLRVGPSNDVAGIPLGPTGDFLVREFAP